MSAAAGKRRRRQAAMGFTHIARADRPKYKKTDAVASKKRLQRLIETERRMSTGKKAVSVKG